MALTFNDTFIVGWCCMQHCLVFFSNLWHQLTFLVVQINIGVLIVLISIDVVPI